MMISLSIETPSGSSPLKAFSPSQTPRTAGQPSAGGQGASAAEVCSLCHAKADGRKLVVALDGTMNQFALKYSNVVDIYGRIDKDHGDQLTYYNSGVGTYANPSRKWGIHFLRTALDSIVDLAIAWNFEKIILAAYRWLSEHYRPGDRIFLFGFSRGAYQARVLAGMIARVGLLKAGNNEQIPFAYELYASGDETMCGEFKKTFSDPKASVHFLGVWDSVSSVGLIRGKTLPYARTGEHICYVRHALALDERRVKFVPEEYFVEHVHKSANHNMESASPTNYVSEMDHIAGAIQETHERLKEVWFVGCHSDVGGTTIRKPDKHLIDEFPAMWMANEARFAGLRFTEAHPHWDSHLVKSLKYNESLRSFWHILEIIPFLGREEDHPNRFRWLLPHLGARRLIKSHQKVHVSVAYVPNYHPKARFWPHSGHSWDNILGHSTLDNIEELNEPMIELDLYDHSAAPFLVRKLREYVYQDTEATTTQHDGDADDALARLSILAVSPSGAEAILNVRGRDNSTDAAILPDGDMTLWDCLQSIVSSSSSTTGITTRIRALKFIDRMTTHGEIWKSKNGPFALRRTEALLAEFIKYRNGLKDSSDKRYSDFSDNNPAAIQKEKWQNQLMLSAITKTILNLLCLCHEISGSDWSSERYGQINDLVLDALTTNNAPEAVSALSIVHKYVTDSAAYRDAILGSLSEENVLPHIKIVAVARLCLHIANGKVPVLTQFIKKSLVETMLGLLEKLTYGDAVIPALFDVSSFYFRKPKTSKVSRASDSDGSLAKICNLVKCVMKNIAGQRERDKRDNVAAQQTKEGRPLSQSGVLLGSKELEDRLQCDDDSFIQDSVRELHYDFPTSKVQGQWHFIAASLGSDAELLNRFIELIQENQRDETGRYKESFADWLALSITSELIMAQTRVVFSLSHLTRTSDDALRQIIVDNDRVLKVIKKSLLSGEDDAIIMASNALFNIIKPAAEEPDFHADESTFKWFKEHKVFELLTPLLSDDNIHVQQSVARVLSRFLQNGDIVIRPSEKSGLIRRVRRAKTLKSLLGPCALQLLNHGHEDGRRLAVSILPLLASGDPEFRHLMRKQQSVRTLLHLDSRDAIACVEKMKPYDVDISMKKQLTIACIELGRELQHAQSHTRYMGQRRLHLWSQIAPFREAARDAGLVRDLGQVLHSGKDDQIKRSVVDVLSFLMQYNEFSSQVLSEKTKFMPALVTLTNSDHHDTAQAAMETMKRLINDPEIRNRALQTGFIDNLANIHRHTRRSSYIREAAIHILHELHMKHDDVEAALSKQHHEDIHVQFDRLRRRRPGV